MENAAEGLSVNITTPTGVGPITSSPWPVVPTYAAEAPPTPSLNPGPLVEIIAQGLHEKRQLLPTEGLRLPGSHPKSPALSCSPETYGAAPSLVEVSQRGTVGGTSHTGSTLEVGKKSSTEMEQVSLQGRGMRIDKWQPLMGSSSTDIASSRNDQVSSPPPRSPGVLREEHLSHPSGSCHEVTRWTLRKRPFYKIPFQHSAPSPATENPTVRRTLRSGSGRKIQSETIAMCKTTKNSSHIVSATKKQLLGCKNSKLDTREPSPSRQENAPMELEADPPRKRQVQQLESADGVSSEGDDNEADNQNLETRLVKWGFVRKGLLHCPCGMAFARRWDARRHWVNTSVHKAERQKLGDFSDSARFRCTKCNEVMSRKDSLRRHMASCGLRKKRRYRSGWNPNATFCKQEESEVKFS